jgi:hypothetical protein
MQPARDMNSMNKHRYAGQVTAILAAGHHLPFEVKGVNVDLPELQVRHDLLLIAVDHHVTFQAPPFSMLLQHRVSNPNQSG